jgi:hypothetical protein
MRARPKPTTPVFDLRGRRGADRMTGGSGVNTYEYGATGVSTPSAPDVITNFHGAMDVIDLRGIDAKLSYAGALSTTDALAARSFGWQVSGGNTFVYVNTSLAGEAVGWRRASTCRSPVPTIGCQGSWACCAT